MGRENEALIEFSGSLDIDFDVTSLVYFGVQIPSFTTYKTIGAAIQESLYFLFFSLIR